jgi:nucleoside-diphosphate-sugar epimerase
MSNILVLNSSSLLAKTIKLITKDKKEFFFDTEEKDLSLYLRDSFEQFVRDKKIETIIVCDSNRDILDTEGFLKEQKIFQNIVDVSLRSNVKKVVNVISDYCYEETDSVIYESAFFTGQKSSSEFLYGKSIFLQQTLLNKLNKTRFLTVIHGEIYGPLEFECEKTNSKIGKLISLFKNAENDKAVLELENFSHSTFQPTYIDSLADIVLFLATENNKTFSVENPVWNIATPEHVFDKDLIWKIQEFFTEVSSIKFTLSEQRKIKPKLLSIEKFISEFSVYPFISLDEGLRRTMSIIREEKETQINKS